MDGQEAILNLRMPTQSSMTRRSLKTKQFQLQKHASVQSAQWEANSDDSYENIKEQVVVKEHEF